MSYLQSIFLILKYALSKIFQDMKKTITIINVKNIQYSSQIVRNHQEKKLFFSDPSPRHIFSKFSKNGTEEYSILEGGRE